jgi:hypothetical protein
LYRISAALTILSVSFGPELGFWEISNLLHDLTDMALPGKISPVRSENESTRTNSFEYLQEAQPGAGVLAWLSCVTEMS